MLIGCKTYDGCTSMQCLIPVFTGRSLYVPLHPSNHGSVWSYGHPPGGTMKRRTGAPHNRLLPKQKIQKPEKKKARYFLRATSPRISEVMQALWKAYGREIAGQTHYQSPPEKEM